MAIPFPSPETIEQRKARQYGTLHHVGIMAHDLACDAHARAKEQLAPEPPPKTTSQPDFAVTFATLSRAIRQAIALEIRLDAPPRTRPAYRDAAPLADPRRILLRRAFHDAVAKDPDRARRRREIDARIDEELLADPAQQIPMEETLTTLCNGLQIHLDVARLPDELIGMPKWVRPYPTPS